jgi:FkbM family methyltransferase
MVVFSRKGFNRNVCKDVLEKGGTLEPLIVSHVDTNGLGLMNPSVLIDNGKVIVNVRNVNYTLYHAEGGQALNDKWGPLVYLNPEGSRELKTTNYIVELDDDLLVKKSYLIDTKKLDVEPIWEFVGLEDIRLARWDGKLYGIGVRRDTTTNGVGRMELSELVFQGDYCSEVSRKRIELDHESYCEKNWMPVQDQPYTFVKWTNPTQVMYIDPEEDVARVVYQSDFRVRDIPDLRGGSQVIPFRGNYLAIVHECDLFFNELNQKDATYMHRWVVWDKDWRIQYVSDAWSFMDGEIEFNCGLAEYNGDLLVTFGFKDNAAYIMKIPESAITDIIGYNVKPFDWGSNDEDGIITISRDVLVDRVYEKFDKVKEGDVVVDIGANCGAFTSSILSRNPQKVYCVEPSKTMIEALEKNTEGGNVVIVNKAIDSANKSNVPVNDNKRVYQHGGTYDTITFMDFVEENGIDHIDFLKVDCECGEYSIFNGENLLWITKNVKSAAVEFHFWGDGSNIDEFFEFRDKYLTGRNFVAERSDNHDIVTSGVMEDAYIRWIASGKYYIQLMIYITF